MCTLYRNAIAAEDIINLSACVKEGGEVRNIREESEIETEFIVFVSNVTPIGKDVKHIIKKGEPVRWRKF